MLKSKKIDTKLKYLKALNIQSYSNKLKASLKRNVLSCFLKLARLLLVLIVVNGSDFHAKKHEQSQV